MRRQYDGGPAPYSDPAGAAKAGIVAMTKTIAWHYGRQGVTAFAIAPGYVDTPFNQVFAETVGVEVAAAGAAFGEDVQPQDVANMIVLLASGLARHATGTTIDLAGTSYVHRARGPAAAPVE